MRDEVITEVWKAKEAVAGQHGYDVRRIVEHIRKREKTADGPVIDLRARKQDGGDRA